MEQVLSYLPPFEGLLPKWLVFVSVVSAVNSVQAYTSADYTSKLYTNGAIAVEPLSGRVFGTWTFLSAVIRMTAAYNINSPVAYDLALWTYGIALTHFVGELIFGNASLRGRFLSPLIVASSSLAWMLSQREAYLGA
ncbi:Ergosterol biosynthetic protein 28 [Penicillium subrubescens]|uniref:Ergosterol biosynthetic protein 28 n=1 Tax=Penicillium subrubescens TaxID=1316194 RepID=A0A1Q5T8G2_9EURO|nr:Ergosterol biosynthetic protein 28 [Penicillium subrubescens]KAJ5912051.1 Ergosterol biosynthetic protein 28 [Penicillium subrubescens]OKO96512.1 Ergosterol biosynthetic protein 28 [Penicillium subrubescens]